MGEFIFINIGVKKEGLPGLDVKASPVAPG